MFSDLKISFIGSGMMAEAMIRAMVAQNMVEPSQITASGPRPERGDHLRNRHGVVATVDNASAASSAGIVVLSLKPQMQSTALPQIRGRIQPDALVISIMAGVPIDHISSEIGHDSIVRSMPNTPAQIGQGISVWTATDSVNPTQLEQARAILASLGEEIFVGDEDYLDMATALSGTGPAYVFMFMEAMIDAGVHLGFSRRIARKLVIQTMRGSVEFADRSPRHVAELRNQVTSPGGTTAEALYRMEKGGLRTVISRGVWAAYQRSIALGQGLKRTDLDQ